MTATSTKGAIESALAAIEGGTDDCVLWSGTLDRDGYGQIQFRRARVRLAHRYVYEMLVGTIPAGLQIDHTCRTKACVNPRHLDPVTARENTLRAMAAKFGRDMHRECRNGHPCSESNTYVTPEGRRGCRPCQRAATARYKARRAERAS